MKVPVSWLKQYVPIFISARELAQRLTMAGNEVGEIEEIGGNWDRDKVVVGHVLKLEPHPNADRLRLPTVDVGNGETITVVCGAPNVAEGQKIAFAREGAQLFSSRSGKVEPLKAATIRGVKSEGMVCSPLELGLSEDHEGILELDADAPVVTTEESWEMTLDGVMVRAENDGVHVTERGVERVLPWGEEAHLRDYTSQSFANLVAAVPNLEIDGWHPETEMSADGVSQFDIERRTTPPVVGRTIVVLRRT